MRYVTVGEPVLIGPKPKPEPVIEEEPEPELTDTPQDEIDQPESEVESEPEPEPEPERGIPQEVLDKVFAEIEEIEQKLKLTDETLLDVQNTKIQADKLKKQAQKIRDDARAESEKIIADTKLEAEKLLDAMFEVQSKRIVEDVCNVGQKVLAKGI